MATQRTRTQKISSGTRVGLSLLGLAVVHSLWIDLFGMPVKAAMEAVPEILLVACHALQPCALVHQKFFEGVVQISLSCWQFVLTLAGVA